MGHGGGDCTCNCAALEAAACCCALPQAAFPACLVPCMHLPVPGWVGGRRAVWLWTGLEQPEPLGGHCLPCLPAHCLAGQVVEAGREWWRLSAGVCVVEEGRACYCPLQYAHACLVVHYPRGRQMPAPFCLPIATVVGWRQTGRPVGGGPATWVMPAVAPPACHCRCAGWWWWWTPAGIPALQSSGTDSNTFPGEVGCLPVGVVGTSTCLN